MTQRIYVASSWRNKYQPAVVAMLRQMGHEVYDFHTPRPGNDGFGWKEIDPNWESWTPERFRILLQHSVAKAGFESDANAVNWATMGVLVLPSGRSAHLEAGYLAGQGKPVHILMPEKSEPELMYRWAAGIHLSAHELRAALKELRA